MAQAQGLEPQLIALEAIVLPITPSLYMNSTYYFTLLAAPYTYIRELSAKIATFSFALIESYPNDLIQFQGVIFILICAQ